MQDLRLKVLLFEIENTKFFPKVVSQIIVDYSKPDIPEDQLILLFECHSENKLKIQIHGNIFAIITWGDFPSDFRQKRYRMTVDCNGTISQGSRLPFSKFVSQILNRDHKIFINQFPMKPYFSCNRTIYHKSFLATKFLLVLNQMLVC